MATYNGERFIQRQLDTILEQLGPDDELIVSDDSSNDGTQGILEKNHNSRMLILHRSAARSPVFNFEHALKHAKGDVIALADQDDIWRGNKLLLVREKFRGKTGLPHLVLFDGQVINDNEQIIDESIFDIKRSRTGFFRNLYDSSYMGCCLAFTRKLLEIALPFPRKILMHDMWIAMLAELCGSIELVPEITISYRKHSTSMTSFSRRFEPLRQVSERTHMFFCLMARVLELRILHPNRLQAITKGTS